MADPPGEGIDGARCLLPTKPFEASVALARVHHCDLAIPNDAGVGNVLVFTRLVADRSRALGRPLRLLTAALRPPEPLAEGDDGFAIWRNNPHVSEIVDADAIDASIMVAVNRERDNLMHFGHMIENVLYYYGLRPRHLRPDLHLTRDEQAEALSRLRDLKRPVVCIHAESSSMPPPGSPWSTRKWSSIVASLRDRAGLFEMRKIGSAERGLGLPSFETTLRQMFALLWACDVLVSFDSATSHVATAFETPVVALWDPMRKVDMEERWQRGFSMAALSRWSYPQNDNIVLIGGDQDDDVNVVVERTRMRLRSFKT